MKLLIPLILMLFVACTTNNNCDYNKSQMKLINEKILIDLKREIHISYGENKLKNRIFQLFLIKQNFVFSDYVLTFVCNYEDFNVFKPDGFFIIDSEYVFFYCGEDAIFCKDSTIITRSKILEKKKLFREYSTELKSIKVGDRIISNYYRIYHDDYSTKKLDTLLTFITGLH
jgi:hypothetical protein